MGENRLISLMLGESISLVAKLDVSITTFVTMNSILLKTSWFFRQIYLNFITMNNVSIVVLYFGFVQEGIKSFTR